LIRTARLDSGALAILEPVRHTDVVSVGLWNVRGSRDEAGQQAGFSHFLEHMLFKGTERRTAFQIASEVERVGGFLNAFTEKEVVCCYCTLPAENLPLAVDVLCDMYFHSTLEAGEIEKEKAVVINEIQTAEDNPEEKAHQLYLEGLWDGHALSRKITGEGAEVSAIGRGALERFYRERFTPGNTVVTASGRLEAEDLLAKLNAGFPSGQSPSAGPAEPGQQPPGRRPAAPGCTPLFAARKPPERRRSWELKRDKFEQVQVYTGISYPSTRRAADYYQDLVFNTLFGESMSSRLFQHLREDRGLCYTVYSFRSYFTDISLWTIYASTTPATLSALLGGLEGELGGLRSEPPTPKEVEDAKSQIRGGMILAKEDMENRMKRLFRMHYLTDRVVEPEESMAMLAEVDRGEVLRLVDQLIRAEAFNLLAYGSRGVRKLRLQAFRF
jgi:predicted Zn-dependent peptidase